MVWPIFPIVVYDKVTFTLLVLVCLGRLLPHFGLPPLLAFFLAPVGVGLYLRFFFLSSPRRGGDPAASQTCDPAHYAARKKEIERIALDLVVKQKKQLRMWKATASNTYRQDQIDARATKEGRLDLSSFRHVIQEPGSAEECVSPPTTSGADDKKKTRCRVYDAQGFRLVDVEASTTFETFVEVLYREGYMPLCVPELRTITVGGAVVGIGIESSSFKYGFFHEGMVEADVLLGSGRVVTATAKNEHADLFSALPNSLGSFGYLLRLRMRVQKMKPVVRIRKTWCESPEALIFALQIACAKDGKGDYLSDFVDAIALSDTGGMLIEGSFTDEIPIASDQISNYSWDGQSFYKTLLKEGDDYMSTRDYVWRWDPDWFWCTQIFPGMGKGWIRHLCGPRLLRSDMYKLFNDKLTQMLPKWLMQNQELVIQDIEVPIEKSAHWIREHCRVVRSDLYGKIKLTRKSGGKSTVPIWLCPVKGTSAPLLPMSSNKLYVNFGFWDALEDGSLFRTGTATKGGSAAGLVNRALEGICPENGAIKTLYSSCYYEEEEFYRRYNGAHYKKIKDKYDPKGNLRGWYQRLKGV